MDGGRERVGTRMRCVCMWMDCLWGQMGVKKKDKKKLTCRRGRVDVGRTAGWRVYMHWHAEGWLYPLCVDAD